MLKCYLILLFAAAIWIIRPHDQKSKSIYSNTVTPKAVLHFEAVGRSDLLHYTTRLNMHVSIHIWNSNSSNLIGQFELGFLFPYNYNYSDANLRALHVSPSISLH